MKQVTHLLLGLRFKHSTRACHFKKKSTGHLASPRPLKYMQEAMGSCDSWRLASKVETEFADANSFSNILCVERMRKLPLA